MLDINMCLKDCTYAPFALLLLCFQNREKGDRTQRKAGKSDSWIMSQGWMDMGIICSTSKARDKICKPNKETSQKIDRQTDTDAR